jgi:sigma-B regulation protein RsbU (phosphoserine phosphatase)
MARGKAVLRSAAHEPGATPDTILAKANLELVEGNELRVFLTVSLGILNLRTGELTVSNAGHLPPVLLDREGPSTWIEPPPGKPLGITGRARFTNRRFLLKPGDGLLVVTDGVTEAQNRDADFYGDDCLLESLRGMETAATADGVIAGVLRDVRTFADGAPQYDDIAILCIRYPGRRTFSASLENTAVRSAG